LLQSLKKARLIDDQ